MTMKTEKYIKYEIEIEITDFSAADIITTGFDPDSDELLLQ